MLVHIPHVLTADQVAHCREVFARAAWEDGRSTAGHQSAQVKKNLQLPEHSPEARALGDLVLGGLENSPLFISAVLPQRVFPPHVEMEDLNYYYANYSRQVLYSHALF